MLDSLETPTMPAAKPRKRRPSWTAARCYLEKMRDDRLGAVADVRRLQEELREAMLLVTQIDDCIAALRST